MTDNRNTILAVILSGLVLIAWQYFYNVPQMERQRAQTQTQVELNKAARTVVVEDSLVGIQAAKAAGMVALLYSPSPPNHPYGADVTFADMNASGSVDLVWVDVSGSEQASWRYLELFPEGRAGLLTEIDSGTGKKQTIEYAPAASFAAAARERLRAWSSRINMALPVVSRVTLATGLSDPEIVREYRYEDGVYDPVERTFAGFSSATTVSPDQTASSGRR